LADDQPHQDPSAIHAGLCRWEAGNQNSCRGNLRSQDCSPYRVAYCSLPATSIAGVSWTIEPVTEAFCHRSSWSAIVNPRLSRHLQWNTNPAYSVRTPLLTLIPTPVPIWPPAPHGGSVVADPFYANSLGSLVFTHRALEGGTHHMGIWSSRSEGSTRHYPFDVAHLVLWPRLCALPPIGGAVCNSALPDRTMIFTAASWRGTTLPLRVHARAAAIQPDPAKPPQKLHNICGRTLANVAPKASSVGPKPR